MQKNTAARSGLDWPILVFYVLFHVAAVGGAFFFDLSTFPPLLFAASYGLRMFGVSAGYHRYFSHRSFKTSRAFQFVLALLAMASFQRGVLWWAATHRWHHGHSDRPGDPSSPVQNGLWTAHVGWLLSARSSATRMGLVRDLARYPELVWLNRYPHLPPVAWAVLTYLAGGLPGLYWGFVVCTVLAFHALAVGNSLAHWVGPRRFATNDNSRNNALYALLSLGEYHNNHHHDPASAKQGRSWREPDLVYGALLVLERLGIIWELRAPGGLPLPTPRRPVGSRAPRPGLLPGPAHRLPVRPEDHRLQVRHRPRQAAAHRRDPR